MKLIIPNTMPSLNQYINAERRNRYASAKMKKDLEEKVLWAVIESKLVPTEKPVVMKYTWYERDKKRDLDNISSLGRKVIQDALVKAGILQGDGWAHIKGFSDTFLIDKKNPRIEVEIKEDIEQMF